MVRKKRSGVRKKFLYFFLNDKLHKVIRSSRAKDELVAWCYPDKKRVLYSFSDVQKNMETAYTMKQTGQILGRHKVQLKNIYFKVK
jgi:hypothetical protein